MNEVAKMNELMIKQKTNTQTTQTQCNEDKRQQDTTIPLHTTGHLEWEHMLLAVLEVWNWANTIFSIEENP